MVAQPTRRAAGRGVIITTSDIHLRGMDRSTVIVDGTRAPTVVDGEPRG
jgi:hypothetical protein